MRHWPNEVGELFDVFSFVAGRCPLFFQCVPNFQCLIPFDVAKLVLMWQRKQIACDPRNHYLKRFTTCESALGNLGIGLLSLGNLGTRSNLATITWKPCDLGTLHELCAWETASLPNLEPCEVSMSAWPQDGNVGTWVRNWKLYVEDPSSIVEAWNLIWEPWELLQTFQP